MPPRSSSAWSGSASSTWAARSRRPAAMRRSCRAASRCSPASSTCSIGASSRRSSPRSSNSTSALAELTAKLKTLKTDADITEWHRLADSIDPGPGESRTDQRRRRADAMRWQAASWHGRRIPLTAALRHSEACDRPFIRREQIQDKIQDLILKDMVSARDEATPPEFKELVERYYEVLSEERHGNRTRC